MKLSGKKYFKLTTKRVATLGTILCINIVFSVIGKFVLGLIPINGFFVVEINFLSYLIAWIFINLFYAVVMVFIGTWIRFLILGDDWIGLIAMNLVDLFSVIIFVLIFNSLSKLIQLKNSSLKRDIKGTVLSSILSVSLTALFALFINWLFIIDLYLKFFTGFNIEFDWIFASIVFGFNILKYSINYILFISIYKVLFKLKEKYIS